MYSYNQLSNSGSSSNSYKKCCFLRLSCYSSESHFHNTCFRRAKMPFYLRFNRKFARKPAHSTNKSTIIFQIFQNAGSNILVTYLTGNLFSVQELIFFIVDKICSLRLLGHVKKGLARQTNKITRIKISGVNQSGIRRIEKWTK